MAADDVAACPYEWAPCLARQHMPSRKTTGPRTCQFCSRVFPTGTHRSVVTEHRKCCASNPLRRRLQCPCGFATHHFGVHRRHRLKCRALCPSCDAAASTVARPLPAVGSRHVAYCSSSWPLSTLPGKFNVLYADPPWSYSAQPQGSLVGLASSHYACMSQDELKALGTQLRAVTEANCVLFLWTSGPLLVKSLEVLSAWGFRYTTKFLEWVKVKKTNRHEEHRMALGWWSMACTEDLLVGVRGSLKGLVTRAQRPSQLLAHPKGAHSEKPEEARRRVEQMLVPERARCLELFARRVPPEDTACAWSVWGNEVGAGAR